MLYRLQTKVIDIEVAAATPSPTINPSVRVILVGHSMGGIVAAETLLAIASDDLIKSNPEPSASAASHTHNATTTSPCEPSSSDDAADHPFMFPYIQGILAFDTPYLGISPSVVAHGAESHYRTASSAYTAFTEAASMFGYGASTMPKSPSQPPRAALPAPPPEGQVAGGAASPAADAAAMPAWQRWGKMAMFAGAAGAVAAGGAAAYMKRDVITNGWSWIGSHLEFVGCLARGEELRDRLEKVISMHRERGLGFTDIVTVLGKAAEGTTAKPSAGGATVAGGFVEIGAPSTDAQGRRLFCNLPKKDSNKAFFEPNVNDKAEDEITAHMNMFTPASNPGYGRLREKARNLIAKWTDDPWYHVID